MENGHRRTGAGPRVSFLAEGYSTVLRLVVLAARTCRVEIDSASTAGGGVPALAHPRLRHEPANREEYSARRASLRIAGRAGSISDARDDRFMAILLRRSLEDSRADPDLIRSAAHLAFEVRVPGEGSGENPA